MFYNFTIIKHYNFYKIQLANNLLEIKRIVVLTMLMGITRVQSWHFTIMFAKTEHTSYIEEKQLKLQV